MGALSEHERRVILEMLKTGAIQNQADVIDREPDVREIDLVHVHLPKLAEADFIDWDRGTGDLSKGPQFGDIEPYLELLETHTDELSVSWP